MTPLSLERRQVIAALQSMGWTATAHPRGLWVFTRPDTGGLHDRMNLNKALLSWRWLMSYMLEQPDDGEFQKIVVDLWETYRQHRFAKTLKELIE